ncbi:MAG: hypothetical protein ACI3YT_10990 [Prevotella sp.]
MRCILMAIAAMMMLFSCGGDNGPSREDLAAKAAKVYYDSLIAGGYAYFSDGFNGTDSLPPHYREQLVVNVKQFFLTQEKAHQGVKDVKIVTAKTDSTTNITNVFLMLCFGDSVNEEIVVPMLEVNGVWKMK